ncbi:hypothetical protein LCGC14_1291390 [marine sediment metagenome]|uniref:Uncharacterized protein n=1 Tax=marine sediment metagenome TaxID=412755 RepID=A0A0F9N8R3_9ZZZZ
MSLADGETKTLTPEEIMDCKICGNNDLLTACFSTHPVCSVCTMKFFGGGEPKRGDIIDVRKRLGLSDGEFLKLDYGAEAARILGRKS